MFHNLNVYSQFYIFHRSIQFLKDTNFFLLLRFGEHVVSVYRFYDCVAITLCSYTGGVLEGQQ